MNSRKIRMRRIEANTSADGSITLIDPQHVKIDGVVYMTGKGVAQEMGMSFEAFRQMVRRGYSPVHYRMGGCNYFLPEDVEEWLHSDMVPPKMKKRMMQKQEAAGSACPTEGRDA